VEERDWVSGWTAAMMTEFLEIDAAGVIKHFGCGRNSRQARRRSHPSRIFSKIEDFSTHRFKCISSIPIRLYTFIFSVSFHSG
jgi:hypothetical protein